MRSHDQGQDAPPEPLPDTMIRLRLYVSGNTLTSSRAIINLRRFCDRHMKDRYGLEVVDVANEPSIAARDGLLALPTLLKLHPLPRKRFIGDMSNEARLLKGLGIEVEQ